VEEEEGAPRAPVDPVVRDRRQPVEQASPGASVVQDRPTDRVPAWESNANINFDPGGLNSINNSFGYDGKWEIDFLNISTN